MLVKPWKQEPGKGELPWLPTVLIIAIACVLPWVIDNQKTVEEIAEGNGHETGWVEFKWREARRTWYPNCGDGPGVLWNPDWDIQEDRNTIIENCGETYYNEVSKWGLSHGIHLGHHFREPEAGDMGAPCSGPSDCNDGFVCNEYDEDGGLCFADPDRSKTPASSEGIEVEAIFEVEAKDRTPCAEGDSDCGEELAALEPGHPTLPE